MKMNIFYHTDFTAQILFINQCSASLLILCGFIIIIFLPSASCDWLQPPTALIRISSYRKGLIMLL